MPIYDYYCDVCNSNFEALQKINEKALKSCLKCKKSGGVVKLISAPGFRLKGDGWYETDFKKNNKKNIHSPEIERKKIKQKKDEK
ncbi:MAG: zinc ribbon domain-containing protein [SAR86 cluster bacterium]|jgi:putative FmdB family regulatory protein|nr:MAG: zinc ribbon domain-containing protein [SAR86 cluster bacterium]|tara:strand:- start:3004 stop:3258 length:255 start_codon:yes stop_codon:yes gene_type:complete